MVYVKGVAISSEIPRRADRHKFHQRRVLHTPNTESAILAIDTKTAVISYSNGTDYGTVVEQHPFSIFGWFWGIINFCYLLTLFDPNYNKHGDKYARDFRPPGSGPPKPPSRKFGGFGPSSNGPPPPPMGGCGCG